MSTTIVTDKLERAAKGARQASDELRGYVSVLNKRIVQPLNCYSGPKSSNISSASQMIERKKRQLKTKADAFDQYARDVTAFSSDVKGKEEELRAKVSRLFYAFGNQYRFNMNKTPQEQLSDFLLGLVGIDGAKVRDFFKKIENFDQMIKERVSNWYRAEGGKEIITAMLSILIAIAAVVAAIAAIFTFGIFLGIIAAIAALCTIANAVVQVHHAQNAFIQANDGDLISARRSLLHTSKEGFASEMKRRGEYEAAFVFGVIDTVSSIIVAAAGLFKTGGKLINFFKAKGGIGEGLKFAWSNGWKSLKNTYKDGGIFKTLVRTLTYSKPSGAADGKHIATQVKKIAGSIKDMGTVMQSVNSIIGSRDIKEGMPILEIAAKQLLLKPLAFNGYREHTTGVYVHDKKMSLVSDIYSNYKKGVSISKKWTVAAKIKQDYGSLDKSILKNVQLQRFFTPVPRLAPLLCTMGGMGGR